MTNPNPCADPCVFEGYHQFGNDDDGPSEPFGSFEIFWLDANSETKDENGTPLAAGWYWWPCFPGCLPEADPIGPFESSVAAYADAQDF